jgi:membrane-associated phospholipid phosphatase
VELFVVNRRLPGFCVFAVLIAGPGTALCQETAGIATLPAEESRTAGSSAGEANVRPETPRFSSLFKPLKSDFRRLVSPDNALLMTLGAAGALTFHAYDHKVARSGWGDRTAMEEALEPGQFVGGALFQSGAAFATYAVGRAIHQPRVANIGADLVRAQIVAQGATQAIKFSARRTRPDGTILSFPSGHTASSFATATVLQSHLGWKVGIPAYAMATWVAASRVQMERHFVSDVIAGATVGILAGRSVTFGRGSARFALTPTAVPGGLGVSVVKVGR